MSDGNPTQMLRCVAIDGPAASGKSTVGFGVARRLDFLYFDTGIMYRAVTWALIGQVDHAQEALEPNPELAGEIAGKLVIDIVPPDPEVDDGRQATVLVDGEDATWQLRSRAVDGLVSVVAANPRVRSELSRRQREIGLSYGRGQGERDGIVMVGRDIGTVVLPEAPLKVYLEAPVKERALRRYRERSERGLETVFEDVLSDLRRRDQIDSQRDVAPLRPASDALIIQTEGLDVETIIDAILLEASRRFFIEVP